jgi:hypothetical protein
MTQYLRKVIEASLLAAVVILAFGCGKGGPKGDKMIVKGTVTIDGKAADGVTISFYGPSDRAASGVVTTQADGSYEVMFNSAAGEGNYKITASKPMTRGGVAPSGEGIDDFQLKLAGGAQNQLPTRYQDVNSSGLSAPLQKGLNEGKNFALKSK